MVSRLPTPVQLANDSTTVAIAGSHTSPTTSAVGMITMSARKTRWVPDAWTWRRRRRAGALAGAAGTVGRSLIAPPPVSGGEDRLLLALQALGQPVDVVGVLDEGLEAGNHHRGGEVRPGVAVEELGDRLGRADELHRLLLQGGVVAGVGLGAGPDDGVVGLEEDVLGLGRAGELEELLGALLVLGVGPHHDAVDGRLDGAGADGRVDLGEGE